VPYGLFADLLVLFHAAFILFAVLGGLLCLKRTFFLYVHLPAAFWAALVELGGWTCPLTPWENALRHLAGQAGYSGDFVAHYLLPLIYPAGLTRSVQIFLGLSVLVLNLGVYGWVFSRWKRP
jgi:hypothetical protein